MLSRLRRRGHHGVGHQSPGLAVRSPANPAAPFEIWGTQPPARPPAPAFRRRSRRSVDDVRADIEARRWFHTFDFGDGLVTPGIDPSHYKTPWMGIPTDLAGKRVLDVGTYEGFFAFEAERRGAREVLAIDHEVWSWPGDESHGNFRFVHQLLGSQVQELDLPVEDLNPDAVGGVFDVVLFLGVLYHARDPIGYLTRVKSVTGGLAIVETVVDLLDIDVPAMAYYPGASLNNDSTNFFGPNLLAVEGMLLEAGFGRAEFLHLWRWHEIEVVAGRPFDPGQEPRSGRAVFSAWV